MLNIFKMLERKRRYNGTGHQIFIHFKKTYCHKKVNVKIKS